MAKQLLEINKFMNGTVTTPDVLDTPEESASYSLNIDAVIKDGSLQSVPTNRIKYVYDSDGTAGGLDVHIDKISLIRSEDKVDAVYWDDTGKKLHFISEIDKNSTIASNNIATTATKLDIPSDFSANSGVSVANVSLANVAMESHSKEVHVGLGTTSGATPKWVGYTNHSQFGSKLSEAIIEEAEVKYPSSVPFLAKTVTVGGATYGISLGGSRIWKINTSTGAFIANSDAGTFENLRSICTDGTVVYVLDVHNTSTYKGAVIKVAVDALSTKAKVIGLPVTYPGPANSQYSDIEFTDTNDRIWVAVHRDNRTTSDASSYQDKLLFNFDIPNSNSSTLATNDFDARMPRTSGGDNSTVGCWVSPSPGFGAEITNGSFGAVNNWIQETFPRSLIKHPSEEGAIFWVCRYSDHASSPVDSLWSMLWLQKSAASLSSTSGDNWETKAAKVADYTEIRTLCINRITEDHSDNTSVPVTRIDNPNNSGGPEANWSDLKANAGAPRTAVNYDSFGLDNDNKLFATIGSTIHRFPTAINNSFTSLATNGPNNHNLGSKVVTTYSVTPSGQSERTGVNVNIGHLVSDDVYLLRADNTAGLDKIADNFSAGASQTFVLDHSAVNVTVAAASTNTGSLLASYEYFYKMSFLYDGYQESNLCVEVFDSSQAADTKNKEVTLSIADTSQIPRRTTDILLYRAESPTANATKPDSLYRLVAQIPLDTVWTTTTDGTTGVTSATLMYEDDGFKGVSYEANAEVPETLTNTMPQFSISAQINNYHFVGNCKHEKIDDSSTYIFRSKLGKFDIFDWVVDFVKVPTVPTALMAFNGRVWAFDKANTYKIEPNNLFIEDIFEGVGCLNDDAIVSTDFGMFFADDKNIYHLTSSMAEPIGEAIVRGGDASGTGNHITAWQNRNKSYHTRAVYDPTRRSVYFSFQGSDNNYYVWAWNIPRKRWDLFSFDDAVGTLKPQGVCTLDTGEIMWGSNDTASSNKQKLKHFVGNAALKRNWIWMSKDLSMGNDTQQKNIKQILLPSRIKANYGIASEVISAGSQVANTLTRGTYRMDVASAHRKTTKFKVRLDSNSSTDECGSVGILFKTKRSPR